MPVTNRTDIVKDALRRFKHLPTRTIARYLLEDYGTYFDNDLEKIRDILRYHRGVHGDRDRLKIGLEEKPAICAVPETWVRTRAPFHLDSGLWLVINDVHIPFHVVKALEAALAYAKQRKVTGILFNGDLQDCASISFWPASRKRDFDKEIELVIDFLDFIEQEFPGVQVVYKPGNHEYRLPRLFQTKVPELVGLPLAAMDTVLGLETRGIEFLDYHQLVWAGKLPILHGHEVRSISTAVNPARGLFMKTKMWAMCGHHHRTSEHTDTNLEGTLLTTWSVGCLCDLSPDYMAYGSNWNWGFALINVEDDGDFEVENKRILDSGKVV